MGGGRSPSRSDARKHHVIPAFYLAGFTKRGSKSDRLNVFDYDTGRKYASTPSKACRKTDYNRVEEPGVDPNETETLLSQVETELAPSLRLVASGGSADRQAIARTLEVAALCAARNRRARDVLAPALAAGIAARLRRKEVSRQQWEQLRASELRNGVPPEEVPGYDDALRLLNENRWFPRPPTVLTVGLVFELARELHGVLMRKRWESHITDADLTGGFICSDNPLVWGSLDSGKARENDETIRPPQQLSDYDVEVSFPVSKSVALVSYPSAREARCQATDDVVAHINARTLHLCGKRIFYGYDDFLTHRTGNALSKGSAYFAYIADARRRGVLNP